MTDKQLSKLEPVTSVVWCTWCKSFHTNLERKGFINDDPKNYSYGFRIVKLK